MNYFTPYDWQTMLTQHAPVKYDISEYFEILCPRTDYPLFLDRYIELPVLQRLAGIGLLCGTDWTKLYKNRFYYSRLDHSKGVALIVWHFTHDKAQTLAGLLHDISTPVFSHVSDFRKGDALTQTATEEPTARIIRADKALNQLLAEDGLTAAQVEDYHIYPVADNEIPQLSADRLEYMFPSGMALDGSWTMEEIRRCYNDITVLKNEDGKDELGFRTLEIAELYCEHFCMIGHILQLNENKLALHMLGQIMNLADKAGILTETDFMTLSEKEVMERLDESLPGKNVSLSGETLSLSGLTRQSAQDKTCTDSPVKPGNDNTYKPEDDTIIKSGNDILSRIYHTFRTMTSIEHTDQPLPENKYFCVNLKVKQRYINPLVVSTSSTTTSQRLYDVSAKARRIIDDFKTYQDTAYGCVKLV